MTFLLKSSVGISIIRKQQSGVMRWRGCQILAGRSRVGEAPGPPPYKGTKRFASPFPGASAGFARAHSVEIVEASLPFLAADSPVLLGGVVAALLPASPGNPTVREAMLRSAEHVIASADFAEWKRLGICDSSNKGRTCPCDSSKAWEKGHTQVASALLSFGDLADLLGLSAALLIDPGKASLPEQLFRAYGNVAIPYLERALSCARGGSPHRA